MFFYPLIGREVKVHRSAMTLHNYLKKLLTVDPSALEREFMVAYRETIEFSLSPIRYTYTYLRTKVI